MSEAQKIANNKTDKQRQAFLIELAVRRHPDSDYEQIFGHIAEFGAKIQITSVVGRLSELVRSKHIYISGEHKIAGSNRTRSLYSVMTPEKLIELKRGQGEIF